MKPRLVVAVLGMLAASWEPSAPALASPGHGPAATATGRVAHADMSDESMRRWSEQWWATHPRVGAPARRGATTVASYTVTNFRFDLDGNASTQVDTARIQVGESVSWEWVGGFHTLTSGLGVGDPAAGQLFDQPIDSSQFEFTFQFNSAGTYHFFCRPHELFDMRGVIIVSTPTGVGPAPGRTHGFTLEPGPNPSREQVRFGFALRAPGRARAEVFDARGRRVARLLDRELAAGEHEGTWDGRGAKGLPVRAGVYYVRLRLSGYSESRSVVIVR